MTHIITDITAYDSKRDKVSLDYGEVTFLLYKARGKCLKSGADRSHAGSDDFNKEKAAPGSVTGRVFDGGEDIQSHRTEAGEFRTGDELSGEKYYEIINEILVPRAKKKALYLLKNADRTENRIRLDLEKGFYPKEVIDKVLEYLTDNKLIDDIRYSHAYAEELKKDKSRREIEAKLLEKGIDRETAEKALEALTEEDEYEACLNAAAKRAGREPDKIRSYLFRRGFDAGVIRDVLYGPGETGL